MDLNELCIFLAFDKENVFLCRLIDYFLWQEGPRVLAPLRLYDACGKSLCINDLITWRAPEWEHLSSQPKKKKKKRHPSNGRMNEFLLQKSFVLFIRMLFQQWGLKQLLSGLLSEGHR